MSYENWTVRQKVGQLFLLAFPGKDGAAVAPLFRDWNLAGCYLSQDNAETFAEARALSRSLAAASPLEPGLPLLLGVDQEGAWGVLVPESHPGPGNLALGAAPADQSRKVYRMLGAEMLDAGFNLLLAPCADVNTDPLSPIIGTRSFGERPADVAARVAAALEGAASSGILTTVKHFPGHGSTSGDTHREIPRVEKTRAQLEAEDFLPFRRGIAAGADVVMTAHILYPALDPHRPATLSKVLLQDILRRDMGFTGVILSDSMNMGAIRRNYASGEAAVLALEAGVDLIMLSEEHYDHSEGYLDRQLATLAAVEAAVVSGRLPLALVHEKLDRILALRQKSSRARALTLTVGEAASVAAEASKAACGVLFDDKDLLPLPTSGVVVVNATPRSAYPKVMNPRGIGPNQARAGFDTFTETLKAGRPRYVFVEAEEFAAGFDRIGADAARILVVTEDYPLPGEDFAPASQQELVRRTLAAWPEKTLVAGLRSPYEVRDYPGLGTYICAFSSRNSSAKALADLLLSGKSGTAESPVTYR